MRLLAAICAALVLPRVALAQAVPLSALPARGTVQGTDMIPILPNGSVLLDQITISGLLSGIGGIGTLPNGQIWVGNALNVAAPQTVSGDCTMTNAAVLTCTHVTIPFINAQAAAGAMSNYGGI